MIKQIRAAFYHNKKNSQYCCLSTDEIPDYLKNGDEVYFIDTGKKYVYDAISGQLYEKQSGGGTSVYPYDGDPEPLGDEASPGTSNNFSRGDHIHPLPSASDIGALPINGGTMSGSISMGANRITGLSDGVNDTDAVTVQQMSSAISQSSAYFKGSYQTRADLLAVAWQTSDPTAQNYVTNNDYAVVLSDETHDNECWRYLYVLGTGWTAQYRINETPLTQAQIDALNSGATANKINSIDNKIDAPSSASINDFLVYTVNGWAAEPLISEVTISNSGNISQLLDAGKIYHFTGSLTSLTITLNPTNGLSQYHFDFNAGATAPTLTIPQGITMPYGFSVSANTHYEIDILNGYGVVSSWATA